MSQTDNPSMADYRVQPLTSRQKRRLWKAVFDWYTREQRVLPWRETRDPYRILVSEVMLQQTQVNHVVRKYREFVKQFPTFQRLAAARPRDVIRAWSGLGYNLRAIRLQKVARAVVGEYRGRLPRDPQQLSRFPGIGKYTAHALASFAFRRRVPVVDTNIRRVFSRLFFRMHTSDQRIPESLAWQIGTHVLPDNRSSAWTLALMDLGSTICKASHPKCASCPVKRLCKSAFPVNENGKFSRAKKPEPSYKGVPNRLYRGRVVEVLRNVNGTGWISVGQLAREMKRPFRRPGEKWLQRLLDGLERDGLVRLKVKCSTASVSLP